MHALDMWCMYTSSIVEIAKNSCITHATTCYCVCAQMGHSVIDAEHGKAKSPATTVYILILCSH